MSFHHEIDEFLRAGNQAELERPSRDGRLRAGEKKEHKKHKWRKKGPHLVLLVFRSLHSGSHTLCGFRVSRSFLRSSSFSQLETTIVATPLPMKFVIERA